MGRLAVGSDGVHVERSTEPGKGRQSFARRRKDAHGVTRPGNRQSDRGWGRVRDSLGATVRSRDDPLGLDPLLLRKERGEDRGAMHKSSDVPRLVRAVTPGKFAKLFL